jgi:cytochrome P450
MGLHDPVSDWERDFDHTDDVWAADPYPVWDELRRTCPVAHTERYGGTWLPTRWEDVAAIAYDTERFSSRSVVVSEFRAPLAFAPQGVAGIDTTWSAIGASIWHLAATPADRERLVASPSLLPVAMEELLRAYAPVTMARLVKEDMDWHGCPMKADEFVLLPFPAANRDPAVFERADEVVIDRQDNRHAAFGLGVHRCVGSHLARMEMRVALEA